jgi:hypothetical protein
VQLNKGILAVMVAVAALISAQAKENIPNAPLNDPRTCEKGN